MHLLSVGRPWTRTGRVSSEQSERARVYRTFHIDATGIRYSSANVRIDDRLHVLGQRWGDRSITSSPVVDGLCLSTVRCPV